MSETLLNSRLMFIPLVIGDSVPQEFVRVGFIVGAWVTVGAFSGVGAKVGGSTGGGVGGRASVEKH